MPQPHQLQAMLKQAQEAMAAQQQAQEALKEERVEASAGGGMVRVVLSGDLHVHELKIDPDAVDPDDVEMLQDMVAAAMNEALRQANELQQKVMGDAGGMGDVDPMAMLDSLGGLGALGAGGPGGGAPGLPGGAAPGMNRAARRAQKRGR